MIKFFGVTNSNQLETEISICNINFSNYAWFWVDFNQPTDEEIRHLADTFKFHPLAIEDCIHRLQRPKLDYYDGYTFFVTHVVREKDKEIIKEELYFFVGENFIVTYHHTPSQEVYQVWERVLQKNIENWDPFYVFYRTLDKIVDNYFPIIYKIEDDLNKIEDDLVFRQYFGQTLRDFFLLPPFGCSAFHPSMPIPGHGGMKTL